MTNGGMSAKAIEKGQGYRTAASLFSCLCCRTKRLIGWSFQPARDQDKKTFLVHDALAVAGGIKAPVAVIGAYTAFLPPLNLARLVTYLMFLLSAEKRESAGGLGRRFPVPRPILTSHR